MKRFLLAIFLMVFFVCASESGAEEIKLTTIVPQPPPKWEYNSSTAENYWGAGPTNTPHTKCALTLNEPGTWIINTSFEAYSGSLEPAPTPAGYEFAFESAFLWAIKATHGTTSKFLLGYVCGDTSNWIADCQNNFGEVTFLFPHKGNYAYFHYATFSGQAIYVATTTAVPITIELQFKEMNTLYVRNAYLTAVKINNNET